jgi:hypothetical protein
MVKEPKKIRKAIENLHELVNVLEFFYSGDKERFKKEILKNAIYIEDTLRQYGTDKKIDHARFISKFKALFAKENEELKEEVKELKEELSERGELIQELVKEIKGDENEK